MFVLCGFIFPLTVTALGQVLFPEQANGSLVKQDGKVIGSKLIGQQWTEPKYFHGRISAVNYNMNANEVKESGGPASGGSNYGNSNPELKKEFKRLLNKKDKTFKWCGDHFWLWFRPRYYGWQCETTSKTHCERKKHRCFKINHLIDENKQASPMADDYVNVLKLNITLDKL